MRRGKVFRALAALALIAALLCGSAMAASMGAKALSASMTVYSSPDRVIGALKRGTSFEVTAISGNWARIRYGNRVGYAKLRDIVFDARIPAVSTKSSSISFMTKDSYRSNTYYTATLRAGVPLYIAGINGDQLLFFDTTGSVMGYVPRSAVQRVTSNQYVYITRTGKRYHNSWCPTLQNSETRKVLKEDAIAYGYTQCGTRGDWY